MGDRLATVFNKYTVMVGQDPAIFDRLTSFTRWCNGKHNDKYLSKEKNPLEGGSRMLWGRYDLQV